MTKAELQDQLDELKKELAEAEGTVRKLTIKLEEVADRFSAELELLTPYAKRQWIEA